MSIDPTSLDQDDQELVNLGDGLWLPKSATVKPEEDPLCLKRFSHPKICFPLMWVVLIISITALIALVILLHYVGGFNVPTAIGIGFAVFGGIILILSRFIAIFAVKLYQHFAPMHIREKCSLTPTCSDYMIQVLLKYGFFIGLYKGIKRMRTCGKNSQSDEYLE